MYSKKKKNICDNTRQVMNYTYIMYTEKRKKVKHIFLQQALVKLCVIA